MKPSPKLVQSFLSTMCQESNVLSGPMIFQKLEEKFGCAPSPATVKTIRRNLRKQLHPVGKSLAAFLDAFESGRKIVGSAQSYVLALHDHRKSDEFHLVRDQKGLSVIFGDSKLLEKAIMYPRFGCDCTFGNVRGYDETGKPLAFELVSMVTKDEETGCIYSAMHQLCTRKATGARLLLFQEFIKQLRYRGLRDPLCSSGKGRLPMATDFETTNVFSLATVLSQEFRPDPVFDYIKAVAVGCDVHAKRCILKKCDAVKDRHLYQWELGTRALNCREECEQALEFMKGMGHKWKHFANWVENNNCAFILWFQKYRCSIPLVERHRALFFDTNSNESYHNRLKSLPKFALKHGRGLELVDALELLRELDQTDAKNLCKGTPLGGYQRTSKPEWRRTQSKARKRNAAEVIVIHDQIATAQQPKKARRASQGPRKRNTAPKQADIIAALSSKMERLENMMSKVLEQSQK